MKDLKIFAKTIEVEALEQIETLLAQEPFKGCKVRIMPDVHAGAGCVIGFTANLGDKVIPNVVGVDIGCGMLTVNLGNIEIDYEKLDRIIRKYVPSGFDVHNKYDLCLMIETLVCYKKLKNVDRLHASLGTLGGGNHFIEIDEDVKGTKYLIIHTGSRNLGKQVADIYQNIAIITLSAQKDEALTLITQLKDEGREHEIPKALKRLKKNRPKLPRDLCYVEGIDMTNYLFDMKICQNFAHINREKIADVLCEKMEWDRGSQFHTIHNYIDDEGMVRKGAISAHAGEKVLIPLNMRDGCILGVGLGNADWNYSAPHGAGRLMSRTKAKAELSLSEYKEIMSDIFTTSVSSKTLDEAPQAYKPTSEIVSCIKDTVQVLEIIKPVYNFKAN
jgi:RNA-splicing ligase RtcB